MKRFYKISVPIAFACVVGVAFALLRPDSLVLDVGEDDDVSGIGGIEGATGRALGGQRVQSGVGVRIAVRVGAHGNQDVVVVTGMVLDAFDSPIEGAQVSLLEGSNLSFLMKESAPLGRSVSCENGTFELTAPASEGTYLIVVAAKGYASIRRRFVFKAASHDPKHLYFRLQRAFTLAGIVVDPAGQAREGVSVCVGWSGTGPWQCGPWRETLSDRNGRFSFDGIPDTEVLIAASTPGQALAVVASSDWNGHDLVVKLPLPSNCGMMIGLARSGDENAEKPNDVQCKLAVTKGFIQTPLPKHMRQVDVPCDGLARVRGLSAATYRLWPSSKIVLFPPNGISARVIKREVTSVTISWSIPSTVSGRLSWVDGRPAAKVRLKLFSSQGRSHAATSDADGRFLFTKVGSRRGTARISGRGFRVRFVDDTGESKRAVRVRLTEVALRLVVTKSPILFGRVVGRNGRGIAGAKISMREAPAGAHVISFASDQAGKFEVAFPRLPSGPIWLEGSGNGGYGKTETFDWVDAVRRKTPIRLTVVEGCRCKGRVTDRFGEPVAGAVVWATLSQRQSNRLGKSKGFTEWSRSVKAKVGRDGNFVLRNLTPGVWIVDITAKGFAPVRRRLNIRNANIGTMDPLNITMLPGAIVSGVAVDSSGHPLAGARAELIERLPGGGLSNIIKECLVAENGNFEFLDLSSSPHQLRFSLSADDLERLGLLPRERRGYPRMIPPQREPMVVHPSSRALVYRYKPIGYARILATIKRPCDDLSKIDAKLVRRTGETLAWAFRAEVDSGRINFGGVLPGEYDFHLSSDEFGTYKARIQVFPNQELDLGLIQLKKRER